jgi:hypothetical protein
MNTIPAIILVISFFLLDVVLRDTIPEIAFLFPILIIFVILVSGDIADTVTYVVSISLVYDLVSGLPMGYFTITTLVVLLTAGFLKKSLIMQVESLILLIAISIPFLLEYYFLLSLLALKSVSIAGIIVILPFSFLILSILYFVFNRVDLFSKPRY